MKIEREEDFVTGSRESAADAGGPPRFVIRDS
jgi:hypothetical protein